MKKFSTRLLLPVILMLVFLASGCEAVLGVIYKDFSVKTAAEADVSIEIQISRSLTFRSSYLNGAKIHVLLLPFFGSIGDTNSLVLNKSLILEQVFNIDDFDVTSNDAVTANFKIKQNAVYYAAVYLDENKSAEKDPDTDEYTYGNGTPDFSDPIMILEYLPEAAGENDDPEPVKAMNFSFRTAGEPATQMTAIVRPDMRVADDDLWILDQLISNPAANERPDADFYLDSSSVSIYQEFVLDGSYCADPDGWITTWVWDMGDGTQLLGKTAYYTYREAVFVGEAGSETDTKTITLTVMDNKGAIDIIDRDITLVPLSAGFVPKAFKVTGQLAISTRDMNKPLKAALFREEQTSGDVVENNLIYQKSLGLVTQRNIEFYFYVNEPGTYAGILWLDDNNNGLIDPREWAAMVQDVPIVAADLVNATTPVATEATFGSGTGSYTVEILEMPAPAVDAVTVEVPGYFFLDTKSRVSAYFYNAINQEGAEQDGSKEEPQEIGLDLNTDCSAALGKSSYYFLDLTGYTLSSNTYVYTITIMEPTRNVDLKIYKPFENTSIVNPIDVVERGVFRASAWEDEVVVDNTVKGIRLLEESYLPGTANEAVNTRIIGSTFGTTGFPTKYLLIEVIPREYYATFDIEVQQTRVEYDAESNESPDNPYALTLGEPYTQEQLAKGDYLHYEVQGLNLGQEYQVTIDGYSAPNDLRLELYADGSFTKRLEYSYTMDTEDEGVTQEQLQWTTAVIGSNDGNSIYLRVYAMYLGPNTPAAGISFNIRVEEVGGI